MSGRTGLLLAAATLLVVASCVFTPVPIPNRDNDDHGGLVDAGARPDRERDASISYDAPSGAPDMPASPPDTPAPPADMPASADAGPDVDAGDGGKGPVEDGGDGGGGGDASTPDGASGDGGDAGDLGASARD